MKIIFIFLLIINAAYVIGMQLHYAEKNTLYAPTLLDSEKIVLLPVAESCLEWGNFYEEQMHYAETMVSEIVSDQSYNVEEADGIIMYWLYIPPLANREAANRLINKLRNLGIVGYRVKEDDKWKNAISIDMLYDREDALNQLKEIEKKGVTNVTVENRDVTLKKIVIHHPTQMIKEQMQKLVEQFDRTLLVQNKCERL